MASNLRGSNVALDHLHCVCMAFLIPLTVGDISFRLSQMPGFMRLRRLPAGMHRHQSHPMACTKQVHCQLTPTLFMTRSAAMTMR